MVERGPEEDIAALKGMLEAYLSMRETSRNGLVSGAVLLFR